MPTPETQPRHFRARGFSNPTLDAGKSLRLTERAGDKARATLKREISPKPVERDNGPIAKRDLRNIGLRADRPYSTLRLAAPIILPVAT